MDVSAMVAYRIYKLKSETKAIAFHTQSEKFMFLEGLSAELLQLVLSGDRKEVSHWCVVNEVTEEDVMEFMEELSAFGFFDAFTEKDIPTYIQYRSVAESEQPEHQNTLNIFLNELRANELYYNFHIDLTNRCNEKCIHCYHPFDEYDYSKELTLEEVKKLVDQIYDLGVFSVTLSGGECLLRKDFFDILAYISSKGMLSVIFTNGVLLTEDVVQQIRKYRVKMVSISLYGENSEVHDRITSVKGSFQKTMAGIELLKKYAIPFELKCVVLAENAEHIEQVRALSKKINYGKDCKVDFSLCGKVNGDVSTFAHQASAEAIKKILSADQKRYMEIEKIEKHSPDDAPCGAGRYGLYCSAEGDIYPCVSFRLLLCHYDKLGDISNNKVLNQWKQIKIKDLSDCLKHDYCDYCSEPCVGNNLIENGNYLDSKDNSRCEKAKIISTWFKTMSR